MADEEYTDITFMLAEGAESFTRTVPVTDLYEGGHVMVKYCPCKIIEKATSFFHIYFVAVDMFTGKEYEETYPIDDKIDVPTVSFREYRLLNLNKPGFLALLNGGTIKGDIRMPGGELGERIHRLFLTKGMPTTVIVLRVLDREVVVDAKVARRWF